MIDSTTDLANPGAYGPSDPGGGAHSTQWSFDLDEAVVSGKDAAYIDDARSGATGVSNERNLDARREGFVRTESDDIDAHAISGGKYKAVALSETVTATDGVSDMDYREPVPRQHGRRAATSAGRLACRMSIHEASSVRFGASANA